MFSTDLATLQVGPPRGEGEGDKAKPKKKITLDNLPIGKGGFRFAAPATWLNDDYFLQSKAGKLLKVNAATGKTEPFYDPAKLAQGLVASAGLSKDTASELAESPSKMMMNPQRTGALFTSGGAYCYCNFDGTGGAKLPKLAGAEMMTFSPDSKRVAFVRGYNLFVFDMETQSERQLTKDGNGILSNGKADWVYYEEIFNRAYKAFWWSPDSKHLAFLHFDDTKVAKYTLIDPTERVQKQEIASYPKAGATNPAVKLGIAAANGDALRWVNLDDYPDKSLLVIRAGWMPDSRTVYAYVQDRARPGSTSALPRSPGARQ